MEYLAKWVYVCYRFGTTQIEKRRPNRRLTFVMRRELLHAGAPVDTLARVSPDGNRGARTRATNGGYTPMHFRAIYVVLTLLCFSPLALAAGGADNSADLAGQVKALQAQVAALQHRVELNEDYIDIHNLQTAYGYYVDKCEWDQAADLFAKDATLEIGLRGVYVGQDRVRAYLHKLPELKYGTLFNHMQLQPKIDVAPDGKTAKARWRAIMQVGILHRSAQWGEATYENEYVKEDGVWKIKKLHAYFTYYANYYKGWDQGGDPPPGPIPGFPPDEPPTETYKLYPEVYVPPYHYKNPVTGK